MERLQESFYKYLNVSNASLMDEYQNSLQVNKLKEFLTVRKVSA